MVMRSVLFVVALALTAAAGARPLRADPTAEGKAHLADWQRAFYGPELIMKHQAAIKLTEAQKKLLIKEVKDAQSDVLDMQFAMYDKSRRALALAQKPTVDEAAVLALADEITALEGKIKRRTLLMNIRIKNALGAEQKKALDRLRPPAGGKP
jgi:Spy/CpxP family protein refolding chaperone